MIFPGPTAGDVTEAGSRQTGAGPGAVPGAVPRSAPPAARLTPRNTALLTGAALLAALIALLGVGVATRGTGELPIPAAGPTTLLRTAVFAALALHIGELAGHRFARTGPAPRSWAVPAALTGAAASAGQLLVLSEVSGLDLAAVYGTVDGRLLLAMANGFLLAAGCAALKRPFLAVLPLAAVIGAEALRAHPEAYTPLLGTGLTTVHLTAASVWTGGLCHVLRTMWLRRADRTGARAVLARYARVAGWLLAALTATGTVSALRRLPFDVVLGSAYGRVLIAKLALVAVASGLALRARARLRGGRDAGGPARAELAVLACVVLVSAVLTVVPDPHWLGVR